MLRMLAPADEDLLLTWVTSGIGLLTGPWRGRTPSREEFRGFIWNDVLVHNLALDAAGVPVASFSAHRADFRSGRCHFRLLAAPGALGRALLTIPMRWFLSGLRDTFGLRLAHCELLADTTDLEAESGGAFKLEGLLRDHEYFQGTYRDLMIYTARLAEVDGD